jgi:hypothetical protein
MSTDCLLKVHQHITAAAAAAAAVIPLDTSKILKCQLGN